MAEFAERSDEHSLAHRVQQASTMRTALLAIFSLAIPVVVVSSAEVAQAQVIYVSPPRVVIHAPPIPLPRFVRRVRVVRVAAPVYYPPPPTVYVPAPPVQIYAPPPEPYYVAPQQPLPPIPPPIVAPAPTVYVAPTPTYYAPPVAVAVAHDQHDIGRQQFGQ